MRNRTRERLPGWGRDRWPGGGVSPVGPTGSHPYTAAIQGCPWHTDRAGPAAGVESPFVITAVQFPFLDSRCCMLACCPPGPGSRGGWLVRCGRRGVLTVLLAAPGGACGARVDGLPPSDAVAAESKSWQLCIAESCGVMQIPQGIWLHRRQIPPPGKPDTPPRAPRYPPGPGCQIPVVSTVDTD